jgi:hypothetical protein
MSGARVQDINTLRLFRAALIKFTESASVALTDAEGEVVRKIGWLEGEQTQFWTHQVRQWSEEVNRAKDAVRQKTIYKDATGRPQSAVDEMKHLKKCQATLAVAEEKLANTRKHARQLPREQLLYRGGVQRLSTLLSVDMPVAIATLDRIVAQLEAYTSAAPTMAESEAGSDASEGSMRRAVDDPAGGPRAEQKNDQGAAGGGQEDNADSGPARHPPLADDSQAPKPKPETP